MSVVYGANRHPAGQLTSRAPAKPGSGQRGFTAPALRTIGGLRSDFHPVLFGKDSIPRNTNMCTYFCFNFSWTRRCVVLCLALRSQLYSGPRFYKAGGSLMDRIILLLLLLTFLVILSK